MNKQIIIDAAVAAGFQQESVVKMIEHATTTEEGYLTKYDDVAEYVVDVEMYEDWLSVE